MQKHDWSARLPEASLVGMARNLRRNWFFPVSALAYFLSETRGAEYNVQEGALALAFLVLCAVSTQSADLWRVTRTLPWYLQFWALLSAAGAAWHCYAFGAVMFPGQPLLVALARICRGYWRCAVGWGDFRFSMSACRTSGGRSGGWLASCGCSLICTGRSACSTR